MFTRVHYGKFTNLNSINSHFLKGHCIAKYVMAVTSPFCIYFPQIMPGTLLQGLETYNMRAISNRTRKTTKKAIYVSSARKEQDDFYRLLATWMI
jgi:hypothetical protein